MVKVENEMNYTIVTASGDRLEINNDDIRSLSLPNGLNDPARIELLLNPMEAIILLERLWELPEFQIDQVLH